MNIIPYILFLLVFAWGLTRLAPGCYFGDCGEVLAALFAGGVPHPTGFPAYLAPATLLARLGGSAFWVHTLSAAFAAACVALLYGLAARVSGSRVAGFLAALVLLSSGTFIVHGAVARVYTMNLALILAFLGLCVADLPPRRRSALLGLTAGLGMAVHLTFLSGPVAALFLCWKDRRAWLRGAIPFLAAFLLASSLYLWLPLVAALDPPVNWGDPDQAGRFWDYLRQTEYRNKMFTRGFDGLLLFYRTIGGAFLRDGPLLNALAAAAGLVVLRRRDRALFRALLGGCLFLLLLFSAYGSERDLHVMYRYFVPVYPLLAVAAAFGYRAAQERLGAAGWRGDAVLAAIVASATLLSAHPWRVLARSVECHDFAANVMRGLPSRACLILDNWADNQIYPLAYGRYLYGWRPDVTFLEWGGKLFPEAPREIRRRGDPTPAPLLGQWMIQERRPFFLAEASVVKEGFALRQEGYLYRMAPASWFATLGPAPSPDVLFRERTHRPHPPDREGEETWIMPLLARARWSWANGDRLEALRYLTLLRKEGANTAPALTNAAILCMEMGERVQAEAFLAEAARLQPKYVAQFRREP